MLDWHNVIRHKDGTVEMPWDGEVLFPLLVQGQPLHMETGERYRVAGVSYPPKNGRQWVGLVRVGKEAQA